MNELFTVKIDRLAGLGDGSGMVNGRKVFVPYTLAGDVVEAKMLRRTTDADYASLTRVIAPAEQRVLPVCRHFTVCGGCSLQHLSVAAYRTFKEDMARAAIRKAGYDPSVVTPMLTFPPASRRRAELKVVNGKLGYFAGRSHDLVDISECKVLEPELEALVLRMKSFVSAWKGLESIQINGLDDGYDVLFTIENPPAWLYTDDPAIRRVSATYGDKVGLLHQSGPATLTLGTVNVEPPPGAFLQAVRAAQDAMTALVMNATGDAVNILDLFAGIGTYSFPMTAYAHVRAVEGDAAMVDALRQTAARHNLSEKFEARRRDLFRDPLTAKDLRHYDAIVINPPRTGSAAQCKEIAETRIPALVMISCNPATFARDARMLNDAGYLLHRVTPVDQFTYSSHLELVAEFTSP